MTTRVLIRWSLVLAGMLGALLVIPYAFEQQPTTAEVAIQLRGVPPPPFPTPEDKLLIPQLKLPKGFTIEVYASGIANARSLRVGDKGTGFVSNRLLDKVCAIGVLCYGPTLHIQESYNVTFVCWPNLPV
jgi:hypothetical protein